MDTGGQSKGNWIKLNRKIWNNFIWSFDSPKYTLAWIDILLMANYEDKKIMFDGKERTIQRGSFVTSMVKLSDRWQMSRRTVKNLLDTLQNNGMITYESTKRCTTVFVSKYEIYQEVSDFSGAWQCTTDDTTRGATDDTTRGATDDTQHKKDKKLEEDKEGKEDSTVSKDTVCSTDVQRIIQEWNGLGLSQLKKIDPGTNRYTLLRARIKSYGADGIIKAIGKVRDSNFLQGGGDKGWVITFDWLIKPNNFPKVFEGNYDDRPERVSGGGRKEAVPDWMKDKEREDAQTELERMKQYLAKLKAEGEPATVGNNPELAARAEALREQLQTDKGKGKGL